MLVTLTDRLRCLAPLSPMLTARQPSEVFFRAMSIEASMGTLKPSGSDRSRTAVRYAGVPCGASLPSSFGGFFASDDSIDAKAALSDGATASKWTVQSPWG